MCGTNQFLRSSFGILSHNLFGETFYSLLDAIHLFIVSSGMFSQRPSLRIESAVLYHRLWAITPVFVVSLSMFKWQNRSNIVRYVLVGVGIFTCLSLPESQ